MGTMSAQLVERHCREPFRMATLVAVLALQTPAPLVAQDKPDFSGRWMLASASPPSPELPPALTVRQSITRTNVYGEPMKPFFSELAVERVFESGTRVDTHRIGVVGGTVAGMAADGTRRGGPNSHHSVTWDGDALVIATGVHTGPAAGTGAWSERREVWSFDADGRLRLSITTSSSDAEPGTVVGVYRRDR